MPLACVPHTRGAAAEGSGAMNRAKPRKLPHQSRSQTMVEAMLEAAARILKSGGYAALNTNKVAAVAGVSVGSVYQYFPNKQALVGALRERHIADVNRLVGGAASEAVGQNMEAAARLVVRASIEANLVDRELHRVLTVEIPDVGYVDSVAEPSRPGPNTVFTRLLPLIATFDPDMAQERVEQIACVSYVVVRGLTHAAIVHGRLTLEPKALEDEIVQVLMGYLSRAILESG